MSDQPDPLVTNPSGVVAVWLLICAMTWATMALIIAIAGLYVGLTPVVVLLLAVCIVGGFACFVGAAYLIP